MSKIKFNRIISGLHLANTIFVLVNGINNNDDSIRDFRRMAKQYFGINVDSSFISVVNPTLYDFSISSFIFIGLTALFTHYFTDNVRHTTRELYNLTIQLGNLSARIVAKKILHDLKPHLISTSNIIVVGHSHGGMAIREFLKLLNENEIRSVKQRMILLTLGCPVYIPSNECHDFICCQYVAKSDFVYQFNRPVDVIDIEPISPLAAHTLSRYFDILIADKNS